MTTGEDGEVLREKIARAIYETAPIMSKVVNYDELAEDIKEGQRYAADAVLALIEPVMEENERYRLALERINDTGDVALDIDWIRRISRAALSPKSEKQDG
jgi:hypothetical protein